MSDIYRACTNLQISTMGPMETFGNTTLEICADGSTIEDARQALADRINQEECPWWYGFLFTHCTYTPIRLTIISENYLNLFK